MALAVADDLPETSLADKAEVPPLLLPVLAGLVSGVEEACLSGRPLRPPLLEKLDLLLRERRRLREASEGQPTRLHEFGQRIWRSCAAESTAAEALAGAKVEARLRRLACELFVAGAGPRWFHDAPLSNGSIPALACCWAVAGRAALSAGEVHEALSCLRAATFPWSSWRTRNADSKDLQLVAEAAVQSSLWASEAHMALANPREAFAALSQARDAMGTSPQLRGTLLDPLLHACYDHAQARRREGDVALAVELLTLALAAERGNVESASGSACRTEDSSVQCGAGNTAHARLLRQLAICHMDSGNLGSAVACAREAVISCPPCSSYQVSSYRVLLKSLMLSLEACRHTNCESSNSTSKEEDEIQQVTVSLMRHPAATVADCLSICEHLQAHGCSTDHILACLAELSKRVVSAPFGSSTATGHDNSLGAQVSVFKFRLQFVGNIVGQHIQSLEERCNSLPNAECLVTNKTVEDHFGDILADIQRANVASSKLHDSAMADLQKDVAQALFALAAKARDVGKMSAAAQWLRRAVPFLPSPRDLADCWAAAAACSWRAGCLADARSWAASALASDGAQLQALLVEFLAVVEIDQDAVKARSVLDRLVLHKDFRVSHALCAAEILAKPRPEPLNSELFVAALEALARCFARGEGLPAASRAGEGAGDDVSHGLHGGDAIGMVGFNGLRVVQELAERCGGAASAGAGGGDGELVRCVTLAAGLLAEPTLRERAARGLRDSGAGASEVGRIVELAWATGQKLGRQRRWRECADVFAALRRLLDSFDGVEIHEVLLLRAWCLVLGASAIVQRSRAGKGCSADAAGGVIPSTALHERALLDLEGAHRLCRRLAAAPRRVADSCDGCGNPDGLATTSAEDEGRRLFVALVLLEFEVRCCAGDPEPQLRQFAEEASRHEALGLGGLLAFAKVASRCFGRSLAMHCLQRYLRVSVGTRGAGAYKQSASVYRELIGLQGSRNESFAIYEGILNLTSGTCFATSSSEPGGVGVLDICTEDELSWLVATAWNNGVHLCRLQQQRAGLRWLSVSLSLAGLCPGKHPEEVMREAYLACLRRCGDCA
eukprot:TRINITY_DN38871_c0_g1_i1.p1 TRINITY_DN38871_c0_g1~~TRINITY_DN38871_c0_g1_i1.p1  ORF type:complete len:1088 (-),score=219.22 TRINITY_DN38871_c0_g1_i1:72-3281(-)